MMRATAMVFALAVLPMAPAAAVVAIEAGGAPAEATAALPPAAAAPDANPFGLSNGELLAALVGLSVISLTVMLGRQPHSVSS